MIALEFDDIYSSFLQKIDAYDFLELSDDEIAEFMGGWIKSAGSKPYVRRLFSTYDCDVDSGQLTFEMAYQVDEDMDTDFVIEILALGMVIEWLRPRLHSIENMYQVFGGNESKFFSQAQHLKEIRALYESTKNEQRKMIRDRGYLYNDYIEDYR